jgi:hypothetical protein
MRTAAGAVQLRRCDCAAGDGALEATRLETARS